MIKLNVDEIAGSLSLYGRFHAMLDDLDSAQTRCYRPTGLHYSISDPALNDMYYGVRVFLEQPQAFFCPPLCAGIDTGVCVNIDGAIFPYPPYPVTPWTGSVSNEVNTRLALLKEIPTLAMLLIAGRIKGESVV